MTYPGYLRKKVFAITSVLVHYGPFPQKINGKSVNLAVWAVPLNFLHDFTLFVVDIHQIRLISLFRHFPDHFHFHPILEQKCVIDLISCHNSFEVDNPLVSVTYALWLFSYWHCLERSQDQCNVLGCSVLSPKQRATLSLFMHRQSHHKRLLCSIPLDLKQSKFIFALRQKSSNFQGYLGAGVLW